MTSSSFRDQFSLTRFAHCLFAQKHDLVPGRAPRRVRQTAHTLSTFLATFFFPQLRSRSLARFRLTLKAATRRQRQRQQQRHSWFLFLFVGCSVRTQSFCMLNAHQLKTLLSTSDSQTAHPWRNQTVKNDVLAVSSRRLERELPCRSGAARSCAQTVP